MRGNHDRWALQAGGQSAELFGYADLAESTVDFLRALPESLRLEVDGKRVVVVHGAPDWDMTFINPEEQTAHELAGFLKMAQADILVCGHTHRPLLIEIPGRGFIANPGALLGPEQAIEGCRSRHCLDGTWGLLRAEPFSFEVRRVGDGARVAVPVHRVLLT